ncbi:MAG: hypothetical protein RLZZ427_751 [Pseudomonadota bacterium]|jgi:hypothetical protein
MHNQRQADVDAALAHAAEVLGDVTPLVMAEFYRQFPDARASFVHHALGDPGRLEAEMVDNALYFVMTWRERRMEVEIIIQTSTPHHAETLGVPAAWYGGLLAATIDVLASAARGPGDAALWAGLRAELLATIDSAMD